MASGNALRRVEEDPSANGKTIRVAGLNHRSAPVEIRERLAVNEEAQEELLDRTLACPEIEEAVVVSTCNRVEIVAATPSEAISTGALR